MPLDHKKKKNKIIELSFDLLTNGMMFLEK